MRDEQNDYDTLVSEDGSSMAAGHRKYNSFCEWYMVFCFTFLLMEAFFNSDLGKMLEDRNYWFTRLTPWNLLPSVMYFYTFGLVIGGGILAAGRDNERIPSKGVLAFTLVCILILVSAAYGAYMKNYDWHRDMRRIILPAIVVPWTVVLAHNIRFNIVMGRFIKIALFFAIANLIRGILFFKGGGRTYAEVELSSGSWQADFGLILPYAFAFSRSITSVKGSKLTVVILAMGIMAPLHKQTIAMFLVANTFLLFMVMYTGRGNVRLSKTILTLFLMGFFGFVFGVFLLSLGGGAAKSFIENRIFKEGRRKEFMSGSGRLEIWRESLVRWTQKPVFGEGLGAAHVTRTYKEGLRSVPVHNFVIQMLMQTGLVGFSIVFISMLLWLIRAVRTLKYESDPEFFWVRLGMVSYVVALMVTCLFGYYIAARCISFTLWFVIALETYGHSRIYHQWRQEAAYV